jgi:hypothetical protein
MLVEQKYWGGVARDQLWSSNPEWMLGERYDPELRRQCGGMHYGSRCDVIPITAYESGYIYPTIRTLNGERAERWMSCFAASLADAEVRPQGEFLHSAQKNLSTLSPEQKIFADIASVEVLDTIRLLGRHTLGMLRGAGQHIMEARVLLHEIDGDQLRRDGIVLDVGSTVQIAPAVVDLIGNEALHTCAAVSQLMHLIYPESVFDSARPVVLPSSGLHLVYQLAVAVAALPEADFAELYHNTPGPPTGLAPFFRVISPEKLVQISLFELQGWASSKEIEPFGTKNESYEQLLATRVPLPMDRPFIALLTLRHLHAQRAWGEAVLDALATVGNAMLEKGFLPEKESFRGVHPCALVHGTSDLDWFEPMSALAV